VFVISLISKGKLQQTIFKSTPEEAVKVAQEWYELYKEKFGQDGYIAIDSKAEGQKENIRFAELKFDSSDGEVKLYVNWSNPKRIFSSKYRAMLKEFLLNFLEFSAKQLVEYLKERNRGSDDF
jgi:hypothetical protein